MSAYVWLGAMVATSVLVVATSSTWQREDEAPFERTPPETPWLTPERAAQIIAADGTLGPLFEGAELGGIAPTADVQARIVAFARANNVDIDLEIVGGWLAAVRFDVTFGGCCGYEGADVLALRLGRPSTSMCCGCQQTWLDHWELASNGVHVRARIRVNRVTVRWEPEATLDQLIARTDELIGRDRVAVAEAAGDRWSEIAVNRRYLIDVPFVFDEYHRRFGLGIEVAIGSGRIVEATVPIRDDRDDRTKIMTALRSRWGRPDRHRDNAWMWNESDRTITADFDSIPPTLSVRMQ